MSEPKPMITPFSSALRFGVITGLLLIFNTWYSAVYSADHNGVVPQWMGLIPLIILVLGLYFAIQDHRKKFEGGRILFKEAVGAGLITTFVIVFLLSIFLFLFNYLDEETRNSLQNAALKSMSPEQQKQAKEMEKDMSPLKKSIGIALFEFARWVMFGFIISFALGLMLGKRKVIQKAK